MALLVASVKESLEKLQHCLMGVSAWMTGSKLKLNPSKTECLEAKNVDVVFDSSLNFQKHISQTCRACFYYIRDKRRIRKRLSLDLAKQIAVALVSRKLDYCDSLLHNMPENDITRLQRVQNCLT